MSALTVAAIQATAHERARFGQAWPKIADAVREAARLGARLAVLPEATVPGYVLGPEPLDDGEIRRALESCADLARSLRIVLVAGAARTHEGRTFNSAAVFDTDGSLAGTADKHFLWHFDRQWFAPGESLAPIRTSLGSIGVLICADGRIPTIARALVDRGAALLAMPTAWVTSGRDPANLENIQADLLGRVRAMENAVPFIAANKCGVELGAVAYCGKSQIVGADGTRMALASQTEPETIVADVLPAQHPPRANIPIPAPPKTRPRGARVAISASALDNDRTLRILEASVAVDPQNVEPACAALGGFAATDELVSDPAGFAAYRLSGYAAGVWVTRMEPQRQELLARARAVECRMYAIVIDLQRARAYAVDPDGAVVCGTFGTYAVASFSYDPERTRQTFVAPGTDVLAGIERLHAQTR